MYSETKYSNNEKVLKQANFRLPADLLEELRELSDSSQVSQTFIVKEALKEKLSQLKGKKLSIELETA